jgi:hypothetical protein
MPLLPGVAIQPNLELKTRPKQLLGSLPLVIALPAQDDCLPCLEGVGMFAVCLRMSMVYGLV